LQQALTKGAVLCRDPASRFVYVGAQGHAQRLYINGDEICVDEGVDGKFVALLADNTQLTATELNTYLSDTLNMQWLCEQIKTGYFLVLLD
jgi:ribosomal protein L16 Arg81 hydroxylase